VRAIPSREQIQAWVLDVTPSEYFERLVDRPGSLVLRAKDRVCEWRGLHLALSDGYREYLSRQLTLLAAGTIERLQQRNIWPDGRAWLNLYTSGVDFGCWWQSTFELEQNTPAEQISVRFDHSAVHVRLSTEGILQLQRELAQSIDGGIKSTLVVSRDTRPSSPAQALWLWRWKEMRSAS
jgi:hypothetical protein